jgi:hypothetical protein
MVEVDPRNALEKLLEVRFHMQRAAWVQREMLRLKPETRQPYANDPNMRVAREAAGLTVEGSMAEDLLGLADTLDGIVFGLDRASAYYWTDAMTAVIIEAAMYGGRMDQLRRRSNGCWPVVCSTHQRDRHPASWRPHHELGVHPDA